MTAAMISLVKSSNETSINHCCGLVVVVVADRDHVRSEGRSKIQILHTPSTWYGRLSPGAEDLVRGQRLQNGVPLLAVRATKARTTSSLDLGPAHTLIACAALALGRWLLIVALQSRVVYRSHNPYSATSSSSSSSSCSHP
jgi:hypothetical protein